jgi:hypothetical protein
MVEASFEDRSGKLMPTIHNLSKGYVRRKDSPSRKLGLLRVQGIASIPLSFGSMEKQSMARLIWPPDDTISIPAARTLAGDQKSIRSERPLLAQSEQ